MNWDDCDNIVSIRALDKDKPISPATDGSVSEGEALLREKGIAPVAILSRAVWKEICLREHLIRIHPNEQGMIALNYGVFCDFMRKRASKRERERRKMEEEVATQIRLAKLFFGFFILLFLVSIFGFLKANEVIVALGAVGGLLFAYLALLWYCIQPDIPEEESFIERIRCIEELKRSGKLYDLLFPGGSDKDCEVKHTLTAQIVLPPMSSHLEELLKRIEGVPIEIAATPDRILFEQHVMGFFAKWGRSERREDEQILRARQWTDLPVRDGYIISVAHKDRVLILGFSGGPFMNRVMLRVRHAQAV